ncbi:cache domain-containing protein [Argonema antarcticum]|uniref:cache domain-containing protein n=1 Tax=Argonema antarcticum TaxID=2942763 RepID=UPI0020120215|nr:cache domain-containing protein [Argonema antarcticum]MCL1470584.1 cache domain-containing protein [Argonema antarcticum A004/B2]
MNIKKIFISSLGFRLTVLILASVIPPMLIGILFTSYRAEKILRQDAKELLAAKGQAVTNLVNQWADLYTMALRNLSIQPDIISMDAQKQKLILTKAASVYKDITITTTGKNGIAVATSDRIKDTQNYSDREWFKRAIRGQLFTRQTLISKTTRKPRLCISTPIRAEKIPQIVGVMVLCKDLATVANAVGSITLGQTGYALLVDNKGQVISHPNREFITELKNFSNYAPVEVTLKKKPGSSGYFSFTEQDGVQWMSYITRLKNGWGVVVQQQEKDVLQEAIQFERIAIGMATLAVLGVGALTWWLASSLVRQSLQQLL